MGDFGTCLRWNIGLPRRRIQGLQPPPDPFPDHSGPNQVEIPKRLLEPIGHALPAEFETAGARRSRLGP
jgi:hypothetical protein